MGGGGLGDSCVGEGLGVDDERNFWDRGDLVTAGKEKSGDGRSSQGGNGSISPGVEILVYSRGEGWKALTSGQG